MFEKLKKKVNVFQSRVDEKAEEKPSMGEKAKKFVKERKVIIDEDDIGEPLEEFKFSLVESDVDYDVAEEIVKNLREELVGEEIKWRKDKKGFVENKLKKSISRVFEKPFDFFEYIENSEKPVSIVFVGTNGVGKTTTIAKLANLLMERGKSVVLANGDTYRAGAEEQIETHAEALGVRVIKHQRGADPAAVIYDSIEYASANNIDVVMADTAGRMHTDVNLMDQIEKIDRVTNPNLTIFVDEAVAGSDAVERAREFHESIDIDAAILTKIDADVKGGAAISISHVTKKPIIFVGIGQSYSDLKEFDSNWFIEKLFE